MQTGPTTRLANKTFLPHNVFRTFPPPDGHRPKKVPEVGRCAKRHYP
jgi:hypothetical protein